MEDLLTPRGPWGWTYDGSGVYSIGREDDPQAHQVATVYRRDPVEGETVCRLIVAALNQFKPTGECVCRECYKAKTGRTE